MKSKSTSQFKKNANLNIEHINIWTGRPYSPVLMITVTKATIFGFSKLFSSSIIKGGNYWENGLNSYFYFDKEFKKTVDDLAKKTLKDPNFVYNFFTTSFKKSKNLRIFSEKYPSNSLNNKSLEELLDFLEEFWEKFYEAYSYATLMALMGYCQENPLYSKINKILKIKTKNCPEKFADYLTALTAHPKKLKTDEQELKILKLANIAKKRGIKTQREIIKNFTGQLKEIKDKFEWLSFDFCDTVIWDVKHYSKLVRSKINTDIQQSIQSIEDYEKNTKNAFKNICAMLGLTKSEQHLFEFIGNLGYYKWAREYEFQEALYNIKFVQDEIGRRFGLSTLETKYLFPEELRQFQQKQSKLKKLAQDRFKNFLVIIDKNKENIFLTGNKAKKEYKKIKFIQENVGAHTKEIKGTPAYFGKAVGKVVIINTSSDLSKMKEGNILVSQATQPNLLPAMKKAAAIVTNEGGITCHAGIVSRELKIPCVVGTKIATKVLKDGDEVKVDANKGIVKILK
jgi:phosphohistidine swiveling domain-containing protein